MKRTFLFFLVFILGFGCSNKPSESTLKNYKFDEFGLSLDSPVSLDTLTKSSAQQGRDEKHLKGYSKAGEPFAVHFEVVQRNGKAGSFDSKKMINEYLKLDGQLNKIQDKRTTQLTSSPVECSGLPATLICNTYYRDGEANYTSVLYVVRPNQYWKIAVHTTNKGLYGSLEDRVIQSVKITPKIQ
jgi:hypothetical protein